MRRGTSASPVDDDPDIRDFIERRIFRDRGFDDITTADDGETGLELIELPRR